jgi:NADPH-dependent ferric siderophore reductase
MNKLTQRAIAMAEAPFLRTATVLGVRAWEPGSIREIDLHLQDCDMSKWTSAQHIKCKVGTLSYRDYTPLGWDAETSTCTLLIHTAHEGIGSRWARRLQAGDAVSYRGVGSSHHQPAGGREMVFLGDESSIGHFLALRQLAERRTVISGAVLLEEPHHQQEFHDYYPGWELEPLPKGAASGYRELDRWVEQWVPQDHPDAVFYLAGYIPSVLRLRKLLRRKGVAGGKVQAQGFWD